jgi:Asp-tRNA(Asn)/Glu-tRNA(Gln) amidotransferase A subunit family amidase
VTHLGYIFNPFQEKLMSVYELRSLNLPKLTGAGLQAFTALVENPLTRHLLLGGLLENGGIPKLRNRVFDEAPLFYPLVQPQADQAEPVAFQPGPPPQSFPYRTARDYTTAYRSGSLTPLEVAERVLAAIEASEQGETPLRAFIAVQRENVLTQARDAAARYAARAPLGPLDGVPVAVKDEVDMLPYPTTVGTCFLGKQPAARDATVVARLRAAGALLVGKTNMHEIGINPNGANANHGTVRNPYNDPCDPGGSSSGSAAAVAAGLVPLAVGADGGGSVRIPAALCGIVGLKPTFGRLSEAGAAPLCWSVAHLGPLAASVEDAALGYALMAGPDPLEPNSQLQPPVTLEGWNRADLHGLRLGIYSDWFNHASADMVQACSAMLAQFKEAGAEVHEITIPELDEMRIAHAITILSEMAICMKTFQQQRSQHGAAVRLSLVLGDTFTASDYLQAQRMRMRAMSIFNEVYRQVDVIISPTTALAAQPIPAGGAAAGWSDLGTDTEMMRFVFPGNLLGLPAISFPVGYDGRGMPLGMQAMGRHWQEHLLLRLAFTAEKTLLRRLPKRYYPLF